MVLTTTQQSDSTCVASWRARPASFVSLMTLYESNYIRLGWLVPDIEQISGSMISTVAGDCPLHLQVEEHSRYTTTFKLTYFFEEGDSLRADPDLSVRVYHDARLAEVRSCAQWHQHEVLRSLQSSCTQVLGDRWARNMMLNKWLDYCVERGHRFER
jgi:uncharacterized protein YqiB (DUF1249 family)